MDELLTKWAEADVDETDELISASFQTLGCDSAHVGPLLSFVKRPEAPVQVLLGGHIDTIYPPRPVTREDNKLYGSGVADMKGGLVVLFHALQAFEQSSVAENLGWQVLINADEERGSIESRPYLEQEGKKFQFGLWFEPALPNGKLVSARKGSANFEIEAHGKAAHAGRHLEEGRSAIKALCGLIEQFEIPMNVGTIWGGTAPNVVPEEAGCTINIRTETQKELEAACETLKALAKRVEKEREVKLVLTGGITRPAKPLTPELEQLMDTVTQIGGELGQTIEWEPSGGVCDGNLLANVGLPTVDTLGVRGGGIHTLGEYLEIDSLAERAELTTALLIHLAKGKS